MIFKNMPEEETFTLRNQENELTEFGPEEIKEYLEDLFVTPDQFVVLSAPKVQGQKIRYVQACVQKDGGIETELGIEQEEGTTLLYKMCQDEECIQIFLDFFAGRLQVNMDKYEPVSF